MKRAKEKHKTNKNQKGITLIALVITIVILLILAGITITTLFGENGLITTAKLADQKTQEGEQNDLDAIDEYNRQLSELINETTGGTGSGGEKPDPEVKVTRITITEPNNLTQIEASQTLQLIATVEPSNVTNKDIIWSSNSKCVNVDQTGKITGVLIGGATITASAADGSGVVGQYTVETVPTLVKVIINWEDVGFASYQPTDINTLVEWRDENGSSSGGLQFTESDDGSYSRTYSFIDWYSNSYTFEITSEARRSRSDM